MFFWIIAVGIFTSVLPYLLYTAGLSKVESGRASVMATIEPVVASLIGVFLYGEQLDLFKMIRNCAYIRGGYADQCETALADCKRSNKIAFKILDGKHTVFIHHIAALEVLFGQGNRNRG